MIIINSILSIILCFVGVSNAAMPVNPSYVSPDGSGVSCTQVAPCALSYANTNATAGDTVYLADGNYTVTGELGKGVAPDNNGTLSNRITFSAQNIGSVKLIGDGTTRNQYGIYLDANYITVNGIITKNFGSHIRVHGSYNEVSYCEVYNTAIGMYTSGGSMVVNNIDDEKAATHNWIHHNTLHNIGGGACNEGGDGIAVGSNNLSDMDCNYNTIENNLIYSMGHTLTESYGQYNVWRNNIGHNEGWKVPTNVIYGIATGGDTTTLVDSNKNFSELGIIVGGRVFVVQDQMDKRGTITGISTTVNDNDTLTFTYKSGSFGSPTYTEGTSYAVSNCGFAPDPSGSSPGNAKYGHRTFAITGMNNVGEDAFNLFEGNRGGYASTNPNNNGSDGLTISAKKVIVRYNALFGSDGPGINLKAYACAGGSGFCAAAGNRIYNNTIYKTGRYITSNSNPPPAVAVYQYNVNSTSNVIKNNIFSENCNLLSLLNDNHCIYYGGSTTNQTWSTNLCDTTDENTGCLALSPGFANTEMGDPTSTTNPTLQLQSSSPAINGGTNLTLANGAGDNNATLHVDDALYFQDGTWGSSLSNIQADWIAIGTVTNTVQISSIDYTTNTITLAEAKTWADDAPIWLYKKSDGEVVLYGSAPDYGAHEYQDASPTTSTSHASGSFNLRR